MTPLSPSYAPGPAAAGREGTRGAPARPLFENPFFYFAESSHTPLRYFRGPPLLRVGNFLFTLPPYIHFGRLGALLTQIAALGESRPAPAGGDPLGGDEPPPSRLRMEFGTIIYIGYPPLLRLLLLRGAPEVWILQEFWKIRRGGPQDYIVIYNI